MNAPTIIWIVVAIVVVLIIVGSSSQSAAARLRRNVNGRGKQPNGWTLRPRSAKKRSKPNVSNTSANCNVPTNWILIRHRTRGTPAVLLIRRSLVPEMLTFSVSRTAHKMDSVRLSPFSATLPVLNSLSKRMQRDPIPTVRTIGGWIRLMTEGARALRNTDAR
ncbi:hypothetical protein SAMN04489752_1910 [Brevibacterium siliguriense]|uniref:Uncharacterized protein n=1 Tax=Brevibacterium siliguriense TaxID=1136497 RepID=A0A1H1SZK6_9MICO|nr:hypothetical protein SAMN04489752_1910 [Brevibacterium siliguriense]